MNAIAAPSTPSVPERVGGWFKSLVAKKRAEPSYPTLPNVDDNGESTVKGLYMIGEVAGTPLVKLGLNAGVDIIDRLHKELGEPSSDEEVLDVVIVGAGPGGLGAARRAQELGLRYVVLEAERVAMTVVNMYKGKPLFAEPHNVENKSAMWFEECSREELLEKWAEQIESFGLNVNTFEKVTGVKKQGDDTFAVTSSKDKTYKGRRVILAVGKAGNPRKAGVKGESKFPQKVHHNLSDPSEYKDANILVYGGGDVALEATLALSEQNNVTIVTIDEELIYPKKRNKDALLEKVEAGQVTLHMATSMVDFDATTATLKDSEGETHTIDNDVVFEMIGAELPLGFFKRIGVKLEGTWDVKKWLIFAAVFVFVYSLYALKKYPADVYSWPFNHLLEREDFNYWVGGMFQVTFFPFKFFFTAESYETMLNTVWFQTGYLYSFAYTVLMGGFGWQAFKRWGNIARDNRYQKWRYISLIGFQVVFFVLANVVAVQALSIEHAWRAWGLYQPWPLFFNTFHWWNDSDPQAVIYFFIIIGLIGSFVAIPVASYKHGKRFCTWICGCGGLAETLGDRWRHLAAKGGRSRSWEFQGVLILAAAFIVTLVTVGMYDTSGANGWAEGYSYVVDFWLVAVIPIALYPFFGGKVWCRYWCPLAAWNGLLSNWYGRLRIKSNEKCISCTQCSKYCQVGVNVMAYAKNQIPFDNSNTACIQCGICIDVCPMDVLAFDVGKSTVRVEIPNEYRI